MKTFLDKIVFLSALFNILITILIIYLVLSFSNILVSLTIIVVQSVLGYLLGKHMSHLENHIATDFLTGLANKRYFSKQLIKEISQAKRNNNNFAIIFLDIDDFKKINDLYGHDIGDVVLKKFSVEMKKIIRDCDLPARWGGDEFAIILHNSAKTETEQIINRLQLMLRKPIDNFKINASIGYTVFNPQKPINSKELIQNADKSLYEVKRLRKNNQLLTKNIKPNLELVENI